jgi:hypothetical protein
MANFQYREICPRVLITFTKFSPPELRIHIGTQVFVPSIETQIYDPPHPSVWELPEDGPGTGRGGVLATASGLLFYCNDANEFMAADAIEWETTLELFDEPVLEGFSDDLRVRRQTTRRNRVRSKYHRVLVSEVARLSHVLSSPNASTKYRAGVPCPNSSSRAGLPKPDTPRTQRSSRARFPVNCDLDLAFVDQQHLFVHVVVRADEASGPAQDPTHAGPRGYPVCVDPLRICRSTIDPFFRTVTSSKRNVLEGRDGRLSRSFRPREKGQQKPETPA